MCCLAPLIVWGQNTPIQYEVHFPAAEHHEAEITVTVPDAPENTTIRMSRSSPGRYALHEFAKNVYGVYAVDGSGDTLTIQRPNAHAWRVGNHDRTVRFHYTLYADHPDGTYSGIDETHAHFNMPSSFVWIEEMKHRAIRIRFHPPSGSDWKAATQLVPAAQPMTFTAPDRDYFFDSPTELSNYRELTWEVGREGEMQTIRMTAHTDASDQTLEKYFDWTKQVIREQRAIFGELPEFDYGTYTFIADYLPYVYWDGMEHRNSTILIGREPLGENMTDYFYTLSHEFIHNWNMERLRAESIEPFNFQEANMSGELWFGEGFTSYYDDLTMKRAGIIDRKKYLDGIEWSINRVVNSPARALRSPSDMSRYSPFVDEAVWIDDQNTENTFISYYTWGAVVALGLDLELRTKFEDVTLDSYMRYLWKKYGIPEHPYDREDIEHALTRVTGDSDFAETFFDRYILDGQTPDYKRLLAKAGFSLQKTHPGEAALDIGRVDLSFDNGRVRLESNSYRDTPLYEAGINRRDEIISIAGKKITSKKVYNKILKRHDPGDEVSITFESRRKKQTRSITFMENPELEIVPYESLDREVTPEMQKLRRAWLGSQVE